MLNEWKSIHNTEAKNMSPEEVLSTMQFQDKHRIFKFQIIRKEDVDDFLEIQKKIQYNTEMFYRQKFMQQEEEVYRANQQQLYDQQRIAEESTASMEALISDSHQQQQQQEHQLNNTYQSKMNFPSSNFNRNNVHTSSYSRENTECQTQNFKNNEEEREEKNNNNNNESLTSFENNISTVPKVQGLHEVTSHNENTNNNNQSLQTNDKYTIYDVSKAALDDSAFLSRSRSQPERTMTTEYDESVFSKNKSGNGDLSSSSLPNSSKKITKIDSEDNNGQWKGLYNAKSKSPISGDTGFYNFLLKKKQDVQNSLKKIIKVEKIDEEEEGNINYFNDDQIEQNFSGKQCRAAVLAALHLSQHILLIFLFLFSLYIVMQRRNVAIGSLNRKNNIMKEKTTSPKNNTKLSTSSNNILDEKDRSLLNLLNKCQNERDNNSVINVNGKRLLENETKIFQKQSSNIDDEDDDVIRNIHALDIEEQSELNSEDSQERDIDSVGPWLEKKFQEIQDDMDDDRE